MVKTNILSSYLEVDLRILDFYTLGMSSAVAVLVVALNSSIIGTILGRVRKIRKMLISLKTKLFLVFKTKLFLAFFCYDLISKLI